MPDNRFNLLNIKLSQRRCAESKEEGGEDQGYEGMEFKHRRGRHDHYNGSK